MTDLDTFRAALQGPDDGLPPAMDGILNAGRKLRFKRRLATATIAAAAVVVAAGSAVALWPSQAPPSGVQAAAWPPVTANANGSWGQEVHTGIRQKKAEIVVTAFHNVNPAYPKITFGVRACLATDVKLAPCTNTFDDVPLDNSPGFHSIELPSNSSGVNFPMYGYYVGPAATITVKSRGKIVTAETATWSEDPDVVFFWFPLNRVNLKPDKKSPLYKLGKVTPGELPDTSEWSAYGADGILLPVGKPFVIG
jgi:hypothetical protein